MSQHHFKLVKLCFSPFQESGEKDSLSQQVADWQQMYVRLSQAGISDADLTLEIQALKNDNAQHKLKIEELNRDIVGVVEERDQYKGQVQRHNSGAGGQTSPSKTSGAGGQTSARKARTLQAQLNKVLAQRDKNKERIGELEKEIIEWKSNLDEQMAELVGRNTDITELKAKYKELQAQVDRQKEEAEMHTSDSDNIPESDKAKTPEMGSLEELLQRVQQLTKGIHTLTSQSTDAQVTPNMPPLGEQLEQITSAVQQFQPQYATLASENHSLKASYQSAVSENDGLRQHIGQITQ